MALSPASSRFNGGTITNPLVIEAPTDAAALTVSIPEHGAPVTSQTIVVQSIQEKAMLWLASDAIATERESYVQVTSPGVDTNAPVFESWNDVLDDTFPLFQIRQDGLITLSAHAAPADAALGAGQMSIWFDQTNGAAKLMIKAKQADGTVKTGSVNVTT